MINIYFDGGKGLQKIRQFESVSISRSFTTLVSQFSLSCAIDPELFKASDIQSLRLFDKTYEQLSEAAKLRASQQEGLPIKGMTIEIHIDNIKVIVGYIVTVSISSSSSGISYTAEGYEKIVDFVQSTTAPVEFEAQMNLLQLCNRALAYIESDIKVVEPVHYRARIPFDTEPPINTEVDTTCFDFIHKYAKLRYLYMHTNFNSDIIFSDGFSETVYIISENILSSSYNSTDDNLFHTYLGYSQSDGDKTTGLVSKYVRPFVRKTRKMGLMLEDDRGTGEERERRLAWLANVRLKNSIKYNCTLAGFYGILNGQKEIWKCGNLVEVTDRSLGLYASQFFINSVEFSHSVDGGSVTSLECGHIYSQVF